MKTYLLLAALLFFPIATACNRPFNFTDRKVEATVREPVAFEEPSTPPTINPPPVLPPVAAPTAPGPSAPAEFVDGVDHPYFPLTVGRTLIYEGDDGDAFRRDEITTLAETRTIAGVACMAMFQEVYLDGELSEITTEWFAQDVEGNVWKFGEESLEFDGAAFVLKEDSWIAGEGGAHATVIFAAAPQVGDVYFAYNPQDGMETLDVVALDASMVVPAGSFEGCIELVENADDEEERDTILYAPGVGLIAEKHSQGKIVLVELR